MGSQKRTRDTYTDEQKIQAVTAMVSVGGEHVLSIEALEAARKVLGAEVATSTLARWKDEYIERVRAVIGNSAQPTELDSVVNSTRQQVIQNYSNFLVSASKRVTEDVVINTASLRDLMVSQGIAIEKLILLTDISPDLSAVVKDYAHVCNRLRLDPVSLLQDYIITIQEEEPRTGSGAIDVSATPR